MKELGWLRNGSILLAVLLVFIVPAIQGCTASTIQDRNLAHAPSTKERAADVVGQPLYDLNVSKTVIPPLLIQASAGPYATPSEAGCAGLKHEIDGLNKILGPDLKPTAIDKRGFFLSKKEAEDASWGIARGFVDGFIPFRGVIRVFTGADRHETAVAHAILAGFVRRAYLEGLEKQQSCASTP